MTELFPKFQYLPKSALAPSRSVPRPESEDRPARLPISSPTAAMLIGKARKIRDAEPWNRIRENEPIVIEDPETGDMWLVSVLGRGCRIFAIHCHLPPEGIHFWRRAIAKEKPKNHDGPKSIRLVACEFENKDEVGKKDLKFVQDHSKVSRKRRGVPIFRSFQPESISETITECEAEKLSQVFDLLLRYLTEAFPRKHKDFYDWGESAEDSHKIPVFRLKEGGLPTYLDDWEVSSREMPGVE